MTVKFNISSTPGYGTYLDDADGMPYGKEEAATSAWQEFFGYKPCLFKNGQVVGYLNPNDYTKFEDGTSADITSGNAGDVMVEFPRRGIKISKSGSTVTVSMTKDPDNSEFTYYAHTSGSTRKDYFYVGVYLCSKNYSGNMMSLSNKEVYHGNGTKHLNYSSMASYKGSRYCMFSFYQFVFIQCMYLLQYKGHLDSQAVHGYGNSNGCEDTGITNDKGLMYGSSSGGRIKIFGIEDLWGNGRCFIAGYYKAANGNVFTYTPPSRFLDSRMNHGYFRDVSKTYITDVNASNELGFTPISAGSGGGPSKYFCDVGRIESSTSDGYMNVAAIGGTYDGTGMGIFYFSAVYAENSWDNYTTSRLMYL